jgi:hypothetical protein
MIGTTRIEEDFYTPNHLHAPANKSPIKIAISYIMPKRTQVLSFVIAALGCRNFGFTFGSLLFQVSNLKIPFPWD